MFATLPRTQADCSVEAYALEAVAEAWQRQASGSPGAKVVVQLTKDI